MNQVANTVILPVEEYEALRAQVLSLTKERDRAYQGSEAQTRDQLAAAQDTIVKLREEVGHALKWAVPTSPCHHHLTMALSLPVNTAALDERLAQERERCAESIEFFGAAMNNNYGRECADAIRSLK